MEKNSSAPAAEVITTAERTTTDDAQERKFSCLSTLLRLILAVPLLALGAAALCFSVYLFMLRILGFPSFLTPSQCDPDCGCLGMYNTIRKSSFLDGLCTFVFWPGAMQSDTDVGNVPCCCAWNIVLMGATSV